VKAYYPDVFCAAMLNSQPMGFYAPAQLVRDAREHGVEIREVDVNFSVWDCTLEKAPFDPARILPRHAEMRDVIKTDHAVRLGFRQIKGLSKERMEAFVERRGSGYESVRDVWLRSGLDVGEIERLAQADAFRSLGLDRREALWAVRALDGKSAAESCRCSTSRRISPARAGARDEAAENAARRACHPRLPLSLGLSLKAHPVAFLRERLDRAGITPNANLPSVRDGRRVSVAGLVLVRQRPGKGNAIFLTLEDDKAVANVIFWPKNLREVPRHRHGSAPRQDSRQAAKPERRHPHGGRSYRGYDASARTSQKGSAAVRRLRPVRRGSEADRRCTTAQARRPCGKGGDGKTYPVSRQSRTKRINRGGHAEGPQFSLIFQYRRAFTLHPARSAH
jgi:DNA polymerase III alpha subunit